jgi:hypothetical protein
MIWFRKIGRISVYLPLLLLLLLPMATFEKSAKAQSACPNPPVISIGSPNVPTDVCVPSGFPGNPIQFFDDFSWKSFIAMIWPALNNQRGQPDASKHVGDTSGPVVFETLKADWELFQANPSSFNTFPPANPCGGSASMGFNDFILASFNKFGNLGEAGSRKLVHALPAQNGTWVRYATAFNQTEYDRIVSDKLYIQDDLDKASPVTLPNNSIDVKSSWIEMSKVPHPERYYTRTATVMDPATGACSQILVGLVGLHIVQKTVSRPQWIWSTFEQVDNVPPADNGAPSPPTFTFNDGHGAPMPSPNQDPNGGFPPTDWSNPKIYNVDRVKPINTSTEGTNAKYRQALGGVWQNYKLVMTQWPVPQGNVPPEGPVPPSQAGTPNLTFPGIGATSSFANTTLETFEQGSIATGCMACHNIANTASGMNPATDFVWSLQMNALAPATLSFAVRAKQSGALRRLQQILE